MSSSNINYAQEEGIRSLAAAIIFVIAYVPFCLLYALKSIRHPTFVYFVLTFFCLIRSVAFVLRAVLAGSSTAQHNENLTIAEEIIYSVSFSGMLYSAYTLVLDREALIDMESFMASLPGPLYILSRLLRNRMIVRILLSVAIIVGIVGTVHYTDATTASASNQALDLRSASVYIFLTISAALAVNTLLLWATTFGSYSRKPAFQTPNGLPPPYTDANPDPYANQRRRAQAIAPAYVVFVLLAIAALAITREAFYTATEHNLAKQNEEGLWYPLSALTEYVAMALFAVPGLVPARSELPEKAMHLMTFG